MKIFLCQDSIEGIFSGVYDAWASKLGHGSVRLSLAGQSTMELFAEYESVPEDREKADKVLRTLKQRLCQEDYHTIYQAALSADLERADSIYRVIVLGLQGGRRVTDNLENPAVCHVFQMARKTANEAHRYLQFVRFRELENGALFAEISPENRVLPLIGDHFSNRLPKENFLIYDNRHRLSLVHVPDRAWVLLQTEGDFTPDRLRFSEEEQVIGESWQAFFDQIAIQERKNARLQQQFLPLKFRSYMTERFSQMQK